MDKRTDQATSPRDLMQAQGAGAFLDRLAGEIDNGCMTLANAEQVAALRELAQGVEFDVEQPLLPGNE